MARTIGTTTTGITKASPTFSPGSAGTIAFWFKPNWSSGDSATHYLFNFLNAAETARFTMLKFSDNNIYAGWVVSPTDYRIVVADTGLFASGTWAHWAIVYNDSANTETLYKNGSVVSHRTAALVTAAVTSETTIGNYKPANAEGGDGDVAEVGLWSGELTAAEVASLAKGFAPPLIGARLLELYLPLHGRYATENDICSPDTYTVTSAARADHPIMYYPQAPFYPAAATVAPPAVTYAPANAIWF